MEFEFAALDYRNPSKNQYAYYMEGLENKWNDNGTGRNATYNKLPPGTYTFHVKGSNNDGIWNEKGATFRIIITPPWWQTWWARTFYVLALIGSV